MAALLKQSSLCSCTALAPTARAGQAACMCQDVQKLPVCWLGLCMAEPTLASSLFAAMPAEVVNPAQAWVRDRGFLRCIFENFLAARCGAAWQVPATQSCEQPPGPSRFQTQSCSGRRRREARRRGARTQLAEHRAAQPAGDARPRRQPPLKLAGGVQRAADDHRAPGKAIHCGRRSRLALPEEGGLNGRSEGADAPGRGHTRQEELSSERAVQCAVPAVGCAALGRGAPHLQLPIHHRRHVLQPDGEGRVRWGSKPGQQAGRRANTRLPKP